MGTMTTSTRLLRRSLLASLLASILAVSGCAGPPRETRAHSESERGLSGNGDTRVLTHEEAQAEAQEMEKVVTDFIHANWSEQHEREWRQQCVVDDTHVIENGASDAYSRVGTAVENHLEVAKAFVKHVRELGYESETYFHKDKDEESWFNFRNKHGLVMAVRLASNKSWIHASTPCYSYDWPELTPTPNPSGSAG